MRVEWAGVVALVTCFVACGGSTFTSFGDGSGTDGGGSDGGSGSDGGGRTDGGSSDGGLAPVCPEAAPQSGTPCAHPDVACEYGNDVSPSCDVIARCTGGRWAIQTPGINCPTPNYGIGPGCPATFAGATGTCAKSGLECDYPEGRCACGSFGGPVPIDGGPGSWICVNPAKGCPHDRPRLGTACSLQENVNCDYGSCFLNGGTMERCIGGVWQEAEFGCPAMAK